MEQDDVEASSEQSKFRRISGDALLSLNEGSSCWYHDTVVLGRSLGKTRSRKRVDNGVEARSPNVGPYCVSEARLNNGIAGALLCMTLLGRMMNRCWGDRGLMLAYDQPMFTQARPLYPGPASIVMSATFIMLCSVKRTYYYTKTLILPNAKRMRRCLSGNELGSHSQSDWPVPWDDIFEPGKNHQSQVYLGDTPMLLL